MLKDVEADVVFGTGGYVAGPAYIAARSLGIPFYVLETNALAGMANKLGVKMGGIDSMHTPIPACRARSSAFPFARA